MTATVDRQQLLVAASTVGAIGFLLAVQHFTTPRGAARHGKRSASAMHHRSANATASQLPHSRPRDESLRPSQRRPAAHASSQPISTTNTQLTVSSLQHHRSRDGKPAAKEELHTPDVVPTLALHHLHRRPTDTPHTPHGAAHTARPEDATNTTNNTTPTRTSAVVRRTSASCKPFRTSSSLQRSPEVLPPRQQQHHHEKRMPDSLGEVSPILPTESPEGLSSLSAWQAVSEGRSSPSPPATAMDQHAAASSSKMVKGTTATDAHHHHDHEQEELSHPHFDAPLHVLPKYLIREAQRQLDAMCEDLTSSPLNARTWMCLYGYLQELPDEATRVILKSWSAPEKLIHLLPANADAVREEDEERRVFTQLRQEVLALLRGEEVHHDTHFEWLGRRVVIAPGRGMPLKRGCLGSIASNGSSGRFSALIIPSDDESEDGAAVADGLAEVVRRYSFVMRQGAHTQWPDEKDEEHGELVRSHTPETPSSISNTPSSAPSMDAITRQVLARIVNLREMWLSGVCPPDSRYFATEMMDLAHTAKEALGGVVAATPMLMPITTNIPATSMMHASRDDHDYGGACGADTTPVAATPHRATSAAQQNSARSPPSAGKPQKPSPLALKKALLATSPQKSGNTSARRRQTTATTTATSATVGTECEGPSVFERLYTPPSTSPTTSNPPSPRQKSARPTFNPYA